jgi:ActR/RegA family two-component response regulator
VFKWDEPESEMVMGWYQLEFSGRPRLLLAYADPTYGSECGRYFRRLGWEVQMVAGGAEARVLAAEYRPNVVVLDAQLIDESGWLTSAKISTENPELRIILVTSEYIGDEQLAMVGAEHAVPRSAGAEGLAHVVLGAPTLSQAV